MKGTPQNDGPLRGLRILDLADEKASFCTKLLADMGACVIKIEKPGGDTSRNIGPFWKDSPHPERSLFFWFNNTNKLGITLNLERGSGREIFCRLLTKVDAVVETFPPGYLSRLGLGFKVLREINPGIILVSVTGFGQTGPHSTYKSCDLIASAMGGQMYVTGDPSVSPLKAYGEQSYYTASLFAAIGILIALRKRNKRGKGEHIDISLQESVASTLEHVMIRYLHDHTIPERQGGLYWNNEFCILPCSDGFILLTLFQQWETLIEWMDTEGMAGDLMDEEWSDEQYRLDHLDHIVEVVRRWTQTHTTGELFEIGQLMRLPWAPVQLPKEVSESPQLKARGFFRPTGHSEIGGSFPYANPCLRFNSIHLTQQKRAPLIGEHNAQIFRGELGLTVKEMQKLSSEGVI